MEKGIFDQIWPIFSAEAREHLSTIGTGILDLEREPTRTGSLDAIRRTAHSLKGSAGSLGLKDVEALAHAIEGSLAGFDPAKGLSRAAVQAALDAVEAIEDAIEAGDAGGEASISAVEALVSALGALPGADLPTSARAGPHAAPAAAPGGAAPADLDGLENLLERVCAPLEPAERRLLAAEGAAAASDLAAREGGAVKEIALRIAATFPSAAKKGEEGARAAAALAGDLVELREALARNAPRAEAAAPGTADGPSGKRGDKSIRVLASTLDSLARQLELLSLAEARHARRSREVLAGDAALREVVRLLEQAAHAIRISGRDVGVGEVAAAVQRVRAVGTDLARVGRDGIRDSDQQRLAGTVLREDLRALRMVPAAIALEPLRRVVRDAAGRLGKEVHLDLQGGEVKLDRRIVDELRDPLMHLARNAVDHGIESPEARVAAGKPREGRILVRVESRGTRVGIVIYDDGTGLDLDAIKSAAVRKGVLGAEAAHRLEDVEAARLVFHPGLSTTRAVTTFSGRGVGLDVVQEGLTRLQGTVDVSSERGVGTRFDVQVPLSLAATTAMLFRSGRDVAALPAEAVDRVLLLAEEDVGTVAGRATVSVQGEQVPYAPLSSIFGSPAGQRTGKRHPALVVSSGSRRVVVGVDEVLGQHELVVSSLGSRVSRVAHLSGAALLDDGRVVGVVSSSEILRRAEPADSAAPSEEERPRIIVADDSLTTRSAMRALLEIAGYSVLPAADGEEALALLREGGAHLVVSDIQMPRLDGFALTRKVKSDPRLRSIPVVLVTSLEAPEDRATGLEAGADGYLVKREVEHGMLLELVRQLLPGRA